MVDEKHICAYCIWSEKIIDDKLACIIDGRVEVDHEDTCDNFVSASDLEDAEENSHERF